MAYLSESLLAKLGLKSLGVNVKISEKASIYEPSLMEIGDNSRIDDFCVISGKVTLGRNVHIAVFSNVAGGEMGVSFEDFSGLAYACHVFSQSDDYSGNWLTNPTVPDKYKRELKAPVLIKRHSIVGTNSLIMPGVTLEEGTSIGAMSMVMKSTKPWSVYVGIPAKKIKDRDRKLLVLERNYLQEEQDSGAGN